MCVCVCVVNQLHDVYVVYSWSSTIMKFNATAHRRLTEINVTVDSDGMLSTYRAGCRGLCRTCSMWRSPACQLTSIAVCILYSTLKHDSYTDVGVSTMSRRFCVTFIGWRCWRESPTSCRDCLLVPTWHGTAVSVRRPTVCHRTESAPVISE